MTLVPFIVHLGSYDPSMAPLAYVFAVLTNTKLIISISISYHNYGKYNKDLYIWYCNIFL